VPKEDLIKYIEEAKSRGVGDDVIRTTLIYAHWTKEEISDAFKGYDESRTLYDPNTISSGTARVRSVNFTNKGKAVAGTIYKKSHATLVFLLVVLVVVAGWVVWRVIEENNILAPVRALPPQSFEEAGFAPDSFVETEGE